MSAADDGGSSTQRASGLGSASSPQSVIGGPSNFDVEFDQEEEDQESEESCVCAPTQRVSR